MSRTIYAAMTGGFGSLSQVMPILETLEAASYTTVYSIAHGAACAVQQLGCRFIPYPDVGAPVRVTPKGRKWNDLDHYWGRFGFGDEDYFTKLIEARLHIVERLKPDLLLSQFCPPTEIIARITGIPIICVTQSCWHPSGRPVCPPEQRDGASYLPVRPVINSVLEKHGASAIGRLEELNRGDLTLIPSFPEFDPIDDSAARYIGPISWQSSATLAPDSVVCAPAGSSRPTILVYTGHLYDSGGSSGSLILDAVVDALKNTEYQVIVTTGLGQSLDCPVPQEPNFEFHPWIPLNSILPHCCLFIHHGGHGSCMAAILNGVPSLVIPTFQEREFNACRLHALGLGAFLLPDDLTPQRLLDSARECIAGRSLQRNLAYWRDELRRREYGGPAAAAALIQNMTAN